MRYKIVHCLFVIYACVACHTNLQASSTVYASSFPGNLLTVIDPKTNTIIGNTISVSPNTECQGLAITPDGKYLYQVNENGNGAGTVGVLNIATNTIVTYISTNGNGPIAVAITPNGDYAYVTNTASDTVAVINTATLQTVGSPIPVATDPYGIAIDPKGRYAYVACTSGLQVDIIDLSTNAVVGSIDLGSYQPLNIAIRPNGKIAYVTTSQGVVAVIDLITNTVQYIQNVGSGELRGVQVAPNGKHVYVANYQDSQFVVIRTADNAIVKKVTLQSPPSQLAILPDGKYAYVGVDAGFIVVMNLLNNTVSQIIDIPWGETTGVAITPAPKHNRLLQAVTTSGWGPLVPLKGVTPK